MDRNLGARDTNYHSDYKGALHYQYGRKDPFVTDGITSYGTNAYIARGGDDEKWTISTTQNQVAISYAVNVPMSYYYTPNASWCTELNSESIIWHDYEADLANQDKSIFDPSPYGWKVGHIDTWSNFTAETMTDFLAVGSGDIPGRSYPRGDNPFAHYVVAGIRHSNGAANLAHYYSTFWSSTPSNTLQSFTKELRGDTFVPYASGGRSCGFTVRPVQHKE